MGNLVSSFAHTGDVLVTSSEKAETPIGHFRRPPATLTVSCDGHKGSAAVQHRQKAPLCCPAPRSPSHPAVNQTPPLLQHNGGHHRSYTYTVSRLRRPPYPPRPQMQGRLCGDN
ncbi:hypothetical protein CH63R_03308 [Colletotrichum higginsianum IMI 349063]|uniref:Uncharacterized protein n=1 Tax=Colletotrichum higginsianum (strain IMI 349063) TaxID=759273 RepID=A0A1B7YRK4_COLHI|nr:hypothetical protein CH63R_03308 [Colletotrichum higginsianum IMI 349063]OBR14582.1 hypothetical protein CH63R_03308 [Colletotrichum higginsianum IMI 349063]